MKELVIDIETIWDETSNHLLPEKGPKERKDPKEKLQFNSNFNQIACIGLFNGVKGHTLGLQDFEFNEKSLLDRFWYEIQNSEMFVTFNGIQFDIPFIYRRSWLHGSKPSVFISSRKYYIENHIDVRMVLNSWDSYEVGSQNIFFQKKFKKTCKVLMEGSQVQENWNQGKYKEVCNYCLDDCKSLYQLYDSMRGYYKEIPT